MVSVHAPELNYFCLRPLLAEEWIDYIGSSGGRGTRAAGWFQDYLDEKGDKDMESVILRGGIKGWATAGEEYVKWMDEYDESIWRALKEGKCD